MPDADALVNRFKQLLIKRLLDIGAQTLLVPVVESPEHAAELVAAVRYPPAGIRGVGTSLARAARWNRVTGYAQRADDVVCLIQRVSEREPVMLAGPHPTAWR